MSSRTTIALAILIFAGCVCIKPGPCVDCPPEAPPCPPTPQTVARPVLPAALPVRFVEQGGGAWLSQEDLRNLVANVTALQDYHRQAEICLTYYETALMPKPP